MSHGEELLIGTEESKQCKVAASTAERLRIISLAVGQLTFNATVMTSVNGHKRTIPLVLGFGLDHLCACHSELHQGFFFFGIQYLGSVSGEMFSQGEKE